MENKQPFHGVFKKRTHDTHMQKHLPYARDEKNKIEVVLIGSSHFERLIWFDPEIIKEVPDNFFVASVGGDKVENMLYRMESKDGLLFALKNRKEPPKKIILMAGSNNIALPKVPESARSIICKLKLLIALIQKELPNTELEIWAVPTNPKLSPAILKYNQALATMCRQLKLGFSREMYDATVRSHSDALFHDHIHLSKEGYRKCVLPLLKN